MRVAVIQGTTRRNMNSLLFESVKKAVQSSDEVLNFGIFEEENEQHSYSEIAMMISLLIESGAVDFVVTGCSSGQGMMLACNSMPTVLCGYAPTPGDAYLFAQINNGNAISLPLGEDYSWSGVDNFRSTIKRLFSEPFGQGYPKSEAERKLKDTILLKEIRGHSQVKMVELLNRMDKTFIRKIMLKKDVIDYISDHGKAENIPDWLKANLK